IEVQRVVSRKSILPARVESSIHVRVDVGLPEDRTVCQVRVDRTAIFIFITAGAEVHREFVLDDGSAPVRVEIPGLIRRPREHVGRSGIQRFVLEIKLHVAVEVPSAGPSDDFDAAESDAAKLGTVRVVVDADLLNLIFGGKPATAEAIDDKRTAAG